MKAIEKEALAVINRRYKKQELQRLASEREGLIRELKSLKQDYLVLNDLQKFALIADNVFKLSFYNDHEVIETIKSFSPLDQTYKVFICSTDFFQALDGYQEQAKYLYPYELIWGFYKLYSSSVIKEKLAFDLDINLSDVGRKVNRQINNLDFPPILKEVINDLKKLPDHIKKEIPNYKMNISEKNPATSVMHIINYAHKNELYNLYQCLVDFNIESEDVEFYEPDFKYEFYDLLEIVLREKTLLSDYEEIRKDYKTTRRFKIKRVERLILS